MKRLLMGIILSTLLVTGIRLEGTCEAELKTIQTHKTKEVVITLRSEAGQWTQGKNAFVLEFTAVENSQPMDVGKVTLSTSMPMPGMAPMLARQAT